MPFPSPVDLPNPGIEPGSPVLQADSLPSEPPGNPWYWGLGMGGSSGRRSDLSGPGPLSGPGSMEHWGVCVSVVLTCSVKKSNLLFSPLFFSEAGRWEEKSLQEKNGAFNPNPMLLERPRRSILQLPSDFVKFTIAGCTAIPPPALGF